MSTRRRVAGGWLLAGTSLAWAGGCALFVSFDDVTLEADGAGGAGGTPPGGGGNGGEPVSVLPPGCDLVVSPYGTAEGTGLDVSSPLASVDVALAIAAELGAPASVCVCGRGTAEAHVVPPLDITTPTSLRGGYDCEEWLRGADFQDLTSDSRTILARDDDEALPTVTLLGAEVTDEVVVDGFQITPPSASSDFVATVYINGASLTLSDNAIGGPSVSAGSTIGVAIEGPSTASVVRNIISSGTGVSTTEPSPSATALSLNNAEVQVLGNFISAESVRGPRGTVGILTGGASEVLIVANYIHGGGGEAEQGVGSSAITVGQGGIVEIYSSLIDGGSGTTMATASSGSEGISVQPNAGAFVARNAIFAGRGPGTHVGVDVNGTAELYSNMIHGGIEGRAIGVRVALPDTLATLVHNTIYAGWPVNAGVSRATGVVMTDGTTTLVHNLVFGEQDPARSHALDLALGANVDVFQGNALLGFLAVTPPPNDPSLASFENDPAVGDSGNNFRMTVSCDSDLSTCYELPSCADGPSCGYLTFNTANGDHGADNVSIDDGTGFQYEAGPPCVLAVPSLSVEIPALEDATINDFLDQPRADPASIGAQQYLGGCLAID